MYNYYSNQLQKKVIVLNPGEYYATSEPVLLSTVLGSCVAVVLFDEKNQIGGINHFMLPGVEEEEQSGGSASSSPPASGGKYGRHAMQLLFEQMFSLGSYKQHLKAKVFGGGAVLHLTNRKSINIPETNVTFALNYLNQQGVPVVVTDVHGNHGRKLFFNPQTFRVHVKRLTPQAMTPVVQEEKAILQKLDKIEP
jgi:chemotaxis protein CheD